MDTSIPYDIEQSCAALSVHGLNSSCSQSGSVQVSLDLYFGGSSFFARFGIKPFIAPANDMIRQTMLQLAVKKRSSPFAFYTDEPGGLDAALMSPLSHRTLKWTLMHLED